MLGMKTQCMRTKSSTAGSNRQREKQTAKGEGNQMGKEGSQEV